MEFSLSAFQTASPKVRQKTKQQQQQNKQRTVSEVELFRALTTYNIHLCGAVETLRLPENLRSIITEQIDRQW